MCVAGWVGGVEGAVGFEVHLPVGGVGLVVMVVAAQYGQIREVCWSAAEVGFPWCDVVSVAVLGSAFASGEAAVFVA